MGLRDKCGNKYHMNMKLLVTFSPFLFFFNLLFLRVQSLNTPAFLPPKSNCSSSLSPSSCSSSTTKRSSSTNSLQYRFETRPYSVLALVPDSNKHNQPTMRAWTCHGRSQREMVEKLMQADIVRSDTVKEALLRVDRANYVMNTQNSYTDAPGQIGFGQTISAPHMHAHVLEELLPIMKKISSESNNNQELKILDVGCGSGYLTTAFGRLVDQGSRGPIHPLKKGRVFGIDVVPGLVDLSLRNTKKADQDLLDSGTVSYSMGDGWKGRPSDAPFHAIHVGAAAATFPTNLMMQLYPHGGTMVIPVGPELGLQNLYKVERLRENSIFSEDDFKISSLLGVRYVPLIHPVAP